MASVHKHCEICHEPFDSDPHVGDRQRVCCRLACQNERKRRAQQRWVAKNPGCFTGRYINVKAWLEAHPGYLKAYRHARRTALAAEPAGDDIQDELSPTLSMHLLAACDIQDQISAKINKSRNHLEQAVTMIYKTSSNPVSSALRSP
jgi:hypothetical protein